MPIPTIEPPRPLTLTFADGGLTNRDFHDLARISASKAVHRYVIPIQLFGPTTEVTTLTQDFVIFKNAATLVKCQAAVAVPATGADRTATVGLSHSDQGAAWGFSIISSLVFDNTSAARTAETETTFTPSAMTAGDMLRVAVTVAGAAGDQAKGLIFTLTVTEIGG